MDCRTCWIQGKGFKERKFKFSNYFCIAMASKQLSSALAAIVSLTAGWVGGANFSTKQETLREVTRYNYLKKRAGGFYDPLFPDFPTKYDIAWAQAHRYHPELLYA